VNDKAHFLEIELGVQRLNDCYHTEMRLSDSEAELARARGEAKFDFEGLLAQSGDWESYGLMLGQALLGDEKIKRAFESAWTTSRALGVPVRFRLAIDPSAAELHGLRWEVLRDPDTNELLTTREHLLFYRYISSPDWRLMELRALDALRALVVIASPSNIESYSPGGKALPPLDVAAEEDRARATLGTIPATILASSGKSTLDSVISQLREGIDIFYLVCHGALIEGEPRLYLERTDGSAEIVLGSDLVTRLCELAQRPRLVILASCKSAAGETEGCEAPLTALGPSLSAAGIPAVIAMQGNVTMQTSATFMSTFFREVQRDGQIDRAVAAARGAVRQRDDWWMPVLFMCLRKGRISWYEPGFTGRQPDFDRWHSLINNIRQGRCTPILGSGLIESLAGSLRDIARHWAETFGYPMAGDECEELPLVAQFLTVNQGEESFVRDKFLEALRIGVLRHYGHELPPEIHKAPLEKLISAAGAIRRKLEVAEPHEVLAQLNLPLYISTNPDNLLTDALAAAGKKPCVALCPRGDYPADSTELDPAYRPTPEEPLVYHLFGNLRDPHSLVLTQDDYFDYLIEVTRNDDLIPATVRSHLVNTALLFLGFQMSDWDFRVLFRSVMSQEGSSRRKRYAHVAVQIDPARDRMIDPDSARRYLEGYFQDTQISIFWGNAEDFLKELLRRMEAEPCGPPLVHARIPM
jgi:CHAT domain-containing protein/SIR2-like protein